MKKTLLLLLSVLAFAISSPANIDRNTDNPIRVNFPPGTIVLRPQVEATVMVGYYSELGVVIVESTPENPVSVSTVDLGNGASEEHDSQTFNMVVLPNAFTPEFMIVEQNGDVTLYGEKK